MDELQRLREENGFLKNKILILEQELRFLKTFKSIQQGLQGETIVKELTGGALTPYLESYDLRIGDKITIEVKRSSLHQTKGIQGYWSWKAPLGQSNGREKRYDFLGV